jgi:arylsulfatase A-like enzyme
MADAFDGGWKVPFIVSWPSGGVTAGGISEAIVSGSDIMPTILKLANVPLPLDRVIDGVDALPAWQGRNDFQHRKPLQLFHPLTSALTAVRTHDWKLHLHHNILELPAPTRLSRQISTQQDTEKPWMWLTDAKRDPLESYDVSDRHPGVAQKMWEEADLWGQEYESNPRGWK